MASTKPATKPTIAAVPKAPKVKRAKLPTLPLAQRFELMTMVKNAPADTPDATLAAQASVLVGRAVQQATIAGYRKQFGIPSVRKPGIKQLHARIAQLEKAITDLGYELPK